MLSKIQSDEQPLGDAGFLGVASAPFEIASAGMIDANTIPAATTVFRIFPTLASQVVIDEMRTYRPQS
jgi:hypothetical protein